MTRGRLLDYEPPPPGHYACTHHWIPVVTYAFTHTLSLSLSLSLSHSLSLSLSHSLILSLSLSLSLSHSLSLACCTRGMHNQRIMYYQGVYKISPWYIIKGRSCSECTSSNASWLSRCVMPKGSVAVFALVNEQVFDWSDCVWWITVAATVCLCRCCVCSKWCI